MKKIIYLTAAFLMLFPSSIFCSFVKDEEKTQIDLTIEKPANENQRNLDPSYINAFLYPNSKDVEVELFNIGDATITILNQWGQVIASDFTTTDIPAIINLNLSSQKGTFCLIVSSSQAFAQGWFVL